MCADDFEVVVAAMEHAPEYVEVCRRFADRLDLISVLSARDFHIPRARNLAMRGAMGEVVVQMDADTLLPPDSLQNLWDHHFAFGQEVCVVGQVVGYGNNEDGDVDAVEVGSYDQHLKALTAMTEAEDWPGDARFKVAHAIPWAFAWTGLIALPNHVVRRHGLYFDESFLGWGVDDLEWGYRVCASRTPIVLSPDVYALHLPHIRDSAANRRTEEDNYGRFLRKWPARDVELSRTVGDVRANGMWCSYLADLRRASGAAAFGVARGMVAGHDVVRFGVPLDTAEQPVSPKHLTPFDAPDRVEILPLTGMSLPYEDPNVDRCVVGAGIALLPPELHEAVLREAGRLSQHVVVENTAG
jgi:glycosyltransferase involved in cell wall biosynthesis